MNVESSATRTINEEGNQVLTVKGRVMSNSSAPVLPVVSDYDARLLKLDASTGEVLFEFEIEAYNAKPTSKALPSVAELNRDQQAQVHELQSQGAETHEAVKQVLSEQEPKEALGELAQPSND